MRGPDEKEFAELVAGRSHSLRRTAYLICGDWHQAEDLVQTAFVKLYCAWGKVNRRDDLDAYLRRTLVNVCIDEKRRGWWRREWPTSAPPDVPDTSAVPVDDRDLLVSGAAADSSRPAGGFGPALLGGPGRRGDRPGPRMFDRHGEEPDRARAGGAARGGRRPHRLRHPVLGRHQRDEGVLMKTDHEWARELFERSRQGEEPAWVADHAAVVHTGRRRNRVRAVAASASVLVTAAAVAVVAIGVGAGVGRKPPVPHPGQSVTPGPTKSAEATGPSAVLDYAGFGTFGTVNSGGKNFTLGISSTTARDTMRLLTELDPALSHIAKWTPPLPTDVRLVPDGDAMARNLSSLGATIWWTDSGIPAVTARASGTEVPTGTLILSFADAVNGSQMGTGSCAPHGASADYLLHPTLTPERHWTDTVQWSPCTKATLPDGSTLLSQTKSDGSLDVADVTRKFPGGRGQIELAWANFPFPTPDLGPDPKRVVSPNPVTVDMLVAAMSDSSLASPLASGR